MDSPVSPKDEIWFLRVCHHISNAVNKITVAVLTGREGGREERERENDSYRGSQ
jgi:hypothetical protein